MATDVLSQYPRTPNPSSTLLSSGEKKREDVSPVVGGSPVNRPSTKKVGYGKSTPPSMKREEMLFEHENGIKVVADGMESLTATDDVEANLTLSVSSPPSCIISSIDELDHGELILVKGGECKWYHARVTDVDIGRGIIERYVKFDGDSDSSDKHVPLKNYSPTDIQRRAPPSPSRHLSNTATTSTPPQVEVSSFSEEAAVKTITELAAEQASVPKTSYRQRMANMFDGNPFAKFVAMPRSPGGPSSWMKKLPPHFHATPKPTELKSYDPQETDPKSSDTSPDKVDHREVESPLMQRQLEVDTDRKEESDTDRKEEFDDTDDLEALGITLVKQALLTDAITNVMSKRATDPDEVADFTLPSRVDEEINNLKQKKIMLYEYGRGFLSSGLMWIPTRKIIEDGGQPLLKQLLDFLALRGRIQHGFIGHTLLEGDGIHPFHLDGWYYGDIRTVGSIGKSNKTMTIQNIKTGRWFTFKVPHGMLVTMTKFGGGVVGDTYAHRVDNCQGSYIIVVEQ